MDIPETRSLIFTAGSEGAAVCSKRRAIDVALMRQDFRVRDVPQSGRAIGAGGQGRFLIGAESNTHYNTTVLERLANWSPKIRAFFEIPEPSRVVVAAREQLPAVGTKGDGIDGVLMSDELAQRRKRGRVVHTYALIGTSADDLAAVTTEGDRINGEL